MKFDPREFDLIDPAHSAGAAAPDGDVDADELPVDPARRNDRPRQPSPATS